MQPLFSVVAEAEPADRSFLPPETRAEKLGQLIGVALAPLMRVLARLRGARAFHPFGTIQHGGISPAGVGAARALGERLSGHALLRFSTAFWNNDREWPDGLGLAIRFRGARGDSPLPRAGDQDLLFNTARSVAGLWLMPFITDVHDFLANDYYALGEFDIAGVGRSYLRVVAARPPAVGDTRDARLFAAIREGQARLRIELMRADGRAWEPCAVIQIRGPVMLPLDDEELRFSPFRTGRDIVPRGFLHATRRAVYPSEIG
jgi:hypothetical protein